MLTEIDHNYKDNCSMERRRRICDAYINTTRDRPFPIVLVKCWKVAYWNAKKLPIISAFVL